jgi:hydroxypyruvate isomerase
MRFTANISMLFKEYPLPERFAKAREAGFDAVEMWWPSGEDLGAVERAAVKSGVRLTGLNFDAGNMPGGDRGLLSDPARYNIFRENVPVALGLADRLGCDKLNALVGLRLESIPLDEQLALARENVAWAADQAAGQGAIILIEAVNTFENGPYLLHSTKMAAEFVKSTGRPNVKLQYDAYHMQRMEGNIVATIREYLSDIAHVQIADSPGRGEPGTGEIYFPYVFEQLEALGYDGLIGLEYKPSTGNTVKSLEWLPQAARSSDAQLAALNIYR